MVVEVLEARKVGMVVEAGLEEEDKDNQVHCIDLAMLPDNLLNKLKVMGSRIQLLDIHTSIHLAYSALARNYIYQ